MTAAIWDQISGALPAGQHRIAAERIRRAESCGLRRIKFFDRLNWSYQAHVDDLVGWTANEDLVWLSIYDDLEVSNA